MWVAFATAVQFLTRIPVPGVTHGSAEVFYAALRRSVVFFPLVGGCVGLCTASVAMCAMYGLSPLVAALLAIGGEAWLTGAFHEDALADTWDALGGGWTREQVLTIMKDSRLGTYGTMSLIIGVGIRIVTTAELIAGQPVWAWASIVAASALGRVAIVAMMVTTEPVVDRDSQAGQISQTQTSRTLVYASLIGFPCIAAWIILSPLTAVCGLLASGVVLAWFRRKIISRVGGTTGDLLGCSAYLVQLVILIASTWGVSRA